MAEFYEVVAEMGKRRKADILDKVKKGYWFFLEDEEIVKKRDFFLHKYGILSWESKYGNPTPFIAEVKEDDTILRPAFDAQGMYNISNVNCRYDMFRTNEDKDCVILSTQYFLLGLSLKDV